MICGVVPQGTVLEPVFFLLITIADIYKDISIAKLNSFTYGTRAREKISDIATVFCNIDNTFVH